MTYSIRPMTDASAWELFVLRHSPEALFQSWSWGEVQSRGGHVIHRHGIYKGETLVGLMQYTKVSARRGAFLHVRHGPVIAGWDKAVMGEAVRYLTIEAKKHGCLFVRMNPLVPVDSPIVDVLKKERALPAAIHRMDGEHCWVLDLSEGEDVLLSHMRKTTRYEIRKAEKMGSQVLVSADRKYLNEFFSLYEETSKRQNFVAHTGIREEFEVFTKSGQAKLYIGSYEKKVTAAALILYYGKQAIYHHGASIHSPAPVSALVQWHAIRDAKKRGMKVYNFWGIADEGNPKHPWRGITLFKKGFGGREIKYLHAHDVPVSPLYIVPRTIEWIRRIRRGYT